MTENRKNTSTSPGKETAAGRPRLKATAVHATGAPAFVTAAAPAAFFALPLAGALAPGSALDMQANASSPLDRALTCCYTHWPSTDCSIPQGTCATGAEYCHSPHFTYAAGFETSRMQCNVTFDNRGGSAEDALVADPAPRLFVAPRGVDLAPESVARMRTLTAVTRLQYLAAMEPELAEKKYADPRGALADLGIAMPDDMQVSIVQDEATGEDVVTVEGFGNTEVLRYSADGVLIPPDEETE